MEECAYYTFACSPPLLNIRVRQEYSSPIPTIPVCIPPLSDFFLSVPISWKLFQPPGAVTSRHAVPSLSVGARRGRVSEHRGDIRGWQAGDRAGPGMATGCILPFLQPPSWEAPGPTESPARGFGGLVFWWAHWGPGAFSSLSTLPKFHAPMAGGETFGCFSFLTYS